MDLSYITINIYKCSMRSRVECVCVLVLAFFPRWNSHLWHIFMATVILKEWNKDSVRKWAKNSFLLLRIQTHQHFKYTLPQHYFPSGSNKYICGPLWVCWSYNEVACQVHQACSKSSHTLSTSHENAWKSGFILYFFLKIIPCIHIKFSQKTKSNAEGLSNIFQVNRCWYNW